MAAERRTPILRRLGKLKASQLLEAEQALELPVQRWNEAYMGRLYPVLLHILTGRPEADFAEMPLDELEPAMDEALGAGRADPNGPRADRSPS